MIANTYVYNIVLVIWYPVFVNIGFLHFADNIMPIML